MGLRKSAFATRDFAIELQARRRTRIVPACAAAWVEMVGSSYEWGKDPMPAMGTYPDTSLAEARKHRDDAPPQVESGKNPGAQR
jgi:hypothetical protein